MEWGTGTMQRRPERTQRGEKDEQMVGANRTPAIKSRYHDRLLNCQLSRFACHGTHVLNVDSVKTVTRMSTTVRPLTVPPDSPERRIKPHLTDEFGILHRAVQMLRVRRKRWRHSPKSESRNHHVLRRRTSRMQEPNHHEFVEKASVKRILSASRQQLCC